MHTQVTGSGWSIVPGRPFLFSMTVTINSSIGYQCFHWADGKDQCFLICNVNFTFCHVYPTNKKWWEQMTGARLIFHIVNCLRENIRGNLMSFHILCQASTVSSNGKARTLSWKQIAYIKYKILYMPILWYRLQPNYLKMSLTVTATLLHILLCDSFFGKVLLADFHISSSEKWLDSVQHYEIVFSKILHIIVLVKKNRKLISTS